MNNRLYVGNLSYDTTAESIRDAFAKVGEVSDVYLATDRMTGQSRGFAFVTMATPELAQSAISQWDGVSLDGRALRVREAEERPRGNGGGGGGFGGGGGGGGGGRGGRGGDRGGRGGGDRGGRW